VRGRAAQALLRTFAGAMSRSPDGRRWIACHCLREQPLAARGIYYFVDFKKGTADIIGEDYPALHSVPLGTVGAMSYQDARRRRHHRLRHHCRPA